MAKLFVFGIGGTGSRVIKALSMLLASGVKIDNTDSIIPIILDPDSANGDMTRTINILQQYKSLRLNSYTEHSDFFGAKISSLDELGDNGIASDKFTYDIDGVKSQLFKDFIGFNELDDNNKAFAALLFSKANLEADMEVGFKGNPNIGSVVLNKFKEAKFFLKFASNFEENDRVFIISSIFGGTGAAGFPLILKNIRDAKEPIPRHAFLNTAKIGAVTVLPYFGVDKTSGATIDSNTFVSKTIAALKYYADNICKNKSINALYYIGDNKSNDQKGADGAESQKNKAHFVELASALAIIDFMSIPDNELAFDGNLVASPKYAEFGLKTENDPFNMNDLSNATYEIIAKPLARYSLFKTYMDKHYDEACNNPKMPHIYHGNNLLSKEKLSLRFRQDLSDFNRNFEDWINEMSQSGGSAFQSVELKKNGNEIFNQVYGKIVKTGFFEKLKSGNPLEQYFSKLNSLERDFDTLDSMKKMMAMQSNATKEIVEKEIKL